MSSVIIRFAPSSLEKEEYRIRIPKKGHGRRLFPSFYAEIELYTYDKGVMKRHYNPQYGELSIGEWLSEHPELKPGDKLRITVKEPMTKYRLELI